MVQLLTRRVSAVRILLTLQRELNMPKAFFQWRQPVLCMMEAHTLQMKWGGNWCSNESDEHLKAAFTGQVQNSAIGDNFGNVVHLPHKEKATTLYVYMGQCCFYWANTFQAFFTKQDEWQRKTKLGHLSIHIPRLSMMGSRTSAERFNSLFCSGRRCLV